MKRLTLILLAVLIFGWQNQLQARLSLGEWQAFMAYDKASTCTYFNGKVYAISEGSLFSYNPEDEDIQTFDIVYPMSDVGITHLALCPTEKVLVIVYENGKAYLSIEEQLYALDDLDTVADPIYLDAYNKAYDFVAKVNQLPNIMGMDLTEASKVDELEEIYDGMNDYEKSFVAKDVVKTLNAYITKVKELRLAEEQKGKTEGAEGNGAAE